MNSDVLALQAELRQLKQEFSERANDIEQRLAWLLAEEGADKSKKIDRGVTDYSETSSFIASVANGSATNTATTNCVEASDKKVKLTPQTDTFTSKSLNIFIQTLLQNLFAWFFDGFSPIRKIYQSYQARGMLGILVLTILGIALTLAGFGYLMQLLIDQLGAGSKSLLMAGAAIFVIVLGIVLSLKTRFKEFASAIVALGVLLFYSTVYFSASVYDLLPSYIALILYLVIALTCHVLAIFLDTKVLASLGIVGIATIPILSNTLQAEPFYYLLSLLFVGASSLILSYRLVGHWLANLTLVFSFLALEWVLNIALITVSVWLIASFYWLFFIYTCMQFYRITEADLTESIKKHRELLIFFAACIGASVVLFFQVGDIVNGAISSSFAVNALMATIVAIFFYQVRHSLIPLLVLVASLWTVLTVISAINHTYWGIAWAAEGLLLFYIGRQYKMSMVIHQGQTLMAIALVYSWSAIAAYFPLPALKTLDGWMLISVTIVIIALWQRLINTGMAIFDKQTRFFIKPNLQLIEAIWLSVIAIALADLYLAAWAGSIIIILQLILLFRAKFCRQERIEYLAALLIVVPLFYVYQAVISVGSIEFTLLPHYAKAALISAFLQLWLWSEFYRRYYANSSVKPLAERVRIIFYMLLPVCWLGSALRKLDENILAILWLSPAIALFLSTKIKHYWLIIETKIIVLLSSITLFVLIGTLNFVIGLIALVGFACVYVMAYWLYKKLILVPLNQYIISWGIVSFGLAIPSLVTFHSYSLFWGLLSASIYWLGCFTYISQSDHLKRNENLITLINLFIMISAWLLIDENSYYAMLPSLFIIVTLYQKSRRYLRTRLAIKLNPYHDLFLHSIAAITYTILFASLHHYRLGLLIAPMLAVHGALILFLKNRNTTTIKYSFLLISLGIMKLALIDAANALLWQKVLLFMGIGIFILFASFSYQKLMEKMSTTAKDC